MLDSHVSFFTLQLALETVIGQIFQNELAGKINGC